MFIIIHLFCCYINTSKAIQYIDVMMNRDEVKIFVKFASRGCKTLVFTAAAVAYISIYASR